MKPFLLSLLLFFTSLSNVFCQQSSLPTESSQFLATYRLTFQPDSTDATVRRSELMHLVLGKSTSVFESVGNHLTDSLYATVADTQPDGDAVQVFMTKLQNVQPTRFRYKVYKNRLANTLYTYDKVDSKLYHYSEKLNSLTWHILPEKRIIAGYACQQASTSFAGRHFEAWFTREIPLPDGPYKFGGLPGFIVKLSDSRQQYVFELIAFVKTARPIVISLPSQPAIAATKANVQRAQRAYYANLKQMVSARTSSVTTTTPESEQAMQSRLRKKYNNALEIH